LDKITGYERAESLLAYFLQGGGGGDVRKILRRINHLIHEIRDSSSLRKRDVGKVLYQIIIIDINVKVMLMTRIFAKAGIMREAWLRNINFLRVCSAKSNEIFTELFYVKKLNFLK
jgi:hypothetical protein